MPTVEDVWKTVAGANLFNGITRMELVDKHGTPVLFSKRLELTQHIIGLLLEAGYVPSNMKKQF